MIIQIYEWASTVFDMLRGLESFFTTGLLELFRSAPTWVGIVFAPVFHVVWGIMEGANFNPSMFTIMFSSSGVTFLIGFGILKYVLS